MIPAIVKLAKKLPTGLEDPKSATKMFNETTELRAELIKGDMLGALLESADVLYYGVKAVCNGLLHYKTVENHIGYIFHITGYWSDLVILACIYKYALRARPGNPKNDAEEREAVRWLLDLGKDEYRAWFDACPKCEALPYQAHLSEFSDEPGYMVCSCREIRFPSSLPQAVRDSILEIF